MGHWGPGHNSLNKARRALERYRHHINLWDVSERNSRQANGPPLKPKHHYLLMGLRNGGMKPELVILQTLAAKRKESGASSHVVIEAKRGWMDRLLEAGHPLTNSAHERPTPMLCGSAIPVFCAKPLSEAAR